MAEVAKVHGSTLRTVYDDRWFSIFSAIGQVTISRASEVEYNHATRQWEARHAATGEIIARGDNRAAVIADEVKWLERNAI